jgi:hypothetical protein
VAWQHFVFALVVLAFDLRPVGGQNRSIRSLEGLEHCPFLVFVSILINFLEKMEKRVLAVEVLIFSRFPFIGANNLVPVFLFF